MLGAVGVGVQPYEQPGVVVVVVLVARLALDVELGRDRAAVALDLDVEVLGLARLVAAGDDRRELVAALGVRELLAVVLVADHVVVAGGVRRPERDDGVRDRRALLVEDAAA